MSKKQSMKPLAAAFGSAVIASLAAMPLAQADTSPFGLNDLGSGYQVAMEGKCGAEKKASKEGKCGEGKCGAAKEAAKEGKCGEGKCGGAPKKAASEGKCGEGKCGGAPKKAASEGKCGEGKCGGKK
ncbi:MAG: hypothetical protein EP297_11540 [Gammaproteobacteria bacterium]|nr:MAG: hypothetical protein EP297_11540 [Gammaproteobacteria bacterium]